MKPLNYRRGNETEDHLSLKREVMAFLLAQGHDLTLCEHRQCDIVALRSGSGVVCIEIERSERNVLKNVLRDFSSGAAAVVIICPNLKIISAVARRLSRSLPQEFWKRTAVATISTLRLFLPRHTGPADPNAVTTENEP